MKLARQPARILPPPKFRFRRLLFESQRDRRESRSFPVSGRCILTLAGLFEHIKNIAVSSISNRRRRVPVPSPVIDQLRQRIERLEAPRRRRDALSFGLDPIDRVLPDGGLAFGALHGVGGGGGGAAHG